MPSGAHAADTVMRLDSVAHRVIARIPAGALISGIVSTDDAVWVVVTPRYHAQGAVAGRSGHDRVTARAPVSASTVDRDVHWAGPELLGGSRAMWLARADRGARIDPRSGRVIPSRSAGTGAHARQWAPADDALWLHATDGQLARFNARTGARETSASSAPGSASSTRATRWSSFKA